MMNKKAHVSEENDSIDRITSLSNDVLTHILSFLGTRNAVQTCILSKTWINTWASVPDLKFDFKEFGLPESIEDHEMCVQQFVTKFELLVKDVLEKREALHVNRFQLCMDSGVFWPCEVLADYIGDMIKLKPRECSIKLCSREKFNLNTNLIFNCASLIYVKLYLYTKGRVFVAMELNSVNLPCLKTLKVDRVTMSDDSFKKLLLGCPVLEELVLENFDTDIFEICSNTLKKLVLSSYYSLMRFQIFTPNLQYLVISKVRDMIGNPLVNMPLLVDASIYLIGWHRKNKYVTTILNLIHSLSNVESLWIDLNFPKKKTQMKDFNFPVFKNLKCLKLKVCVADFLNEETTLEGMRLVQREYLKTVRIVRFRNYNGLLDWLIDMLFAHVKIIGDFVINDLVDDY